MDINQKTDSKIAEQDRQRRIGQQLMLIRLLMVEDKKAERGCPTFIKPADIALWMDESVEKVEGYISDFNSMDPFAVAQETAKVFCRDKAEVDIGYVFRTMYHFGPKYIWSILENQAFDFERGYKKNWSDFTNIREYQGADRSVTDEQSFRMILDCYRDHFLKQMHKLEEGYDKDVIDLLVYGPVKK